MKKFKLKKRQPNYWLVGANWNGKDKTETFIRGNHWEMCYSDEEQKSFAELRGKIKAGDRMAIKARCGQGSDQIRIKAIGIVIGQESLENGKVFVDWKVTGMDRLVDARGCFKAIHGPYVSGDENKGEWIREAFLL